MGFVGFAAFFGSVVACFFIPRMGDLYGRKKVWLACHLFQAFILVAVAVTTLPKVLTLVAFFSGFTIVGRLSAGFLLLMETQASKH